MISLPHEHGCVSRIGCYQRAQKQTPHLLGGGEEEGGRSATSASRPRAITCSNSTRLRSTACTHSHIQEPRLSPPST